MRPARRALLFLFVAFFMFASPAEPPPDPWTRVRSTNFEMFTTAGERSGRDLVVYLEQVRSFFVQAFQLSSQGTEPVRIVCFRTSQEFQQYRPSQVADAFFQSGVGHDYIVMPFSTTDFYPTAVHEYTHLLLHETRFDLPLWLSEGLAELYSNIEPRAGQVFVGTPIPMRMQSISREPWIDLHTLVGMDVVSNQKARAAMFYAESWALVHMLSLDGRYSGHLRQFFDALHSSDSTRALQTAYGKSVAKVQEDLRAYIRASSLNTAVFDLKMHGPRGEPEVWTRASLQARLALVELVSSERKHVAQAEASYRVLAREHANSPEVEEAWAEFCAREGRYPEAVRHFVRAEGLGGASAHLYLEYGRVLAHSNHLQESIGALRKCLQLDAALDEAHFELAVALVHAGQDRDAVAEFHRIKKLGPEFAFRYFYYLAVAHSRLGDVSQTRRLVERARPESRNRDEQAALDRLLHSLGPE